MAIMPTSVIRFARACTPTTIAYYWRQPRERATVLDLRPTRFVTPGGLVALCLIARDLVEKGHSVRFVLSSAIAGYLWRMGLDDYFRHIREVGFDPPIDTWGLSQTQQRGSLLELTTVIVHDDYEVNSAVEAVADVLAVQLPNIGEDERYAVVQAVAELLSNVHRHSRQEEALLAVHAYRAEVVLSVGDPGCGVRASLNRLHGDEINAMTDDQVLHYATRAGVCGSAFGGGYGLYMQRDWVERRGIAFHLMSGRGYIGLWQGRRSFGTSGMAHIIQGTLTEMHVLR